MNAEERIAKFVRDSRTFRVGIYKSGEESVNLEFVHAAQAGLERMLADGENPDCPMQIVGHFEGQPEEDESCMVLAYIDSSNDCSKCGAIFTELADIVLNRDTAPFAFKVMSYCVPSCDHTTCLLRPHPLYPQKAAIRSSLSLVYFFGDNCLSKGIKMVYDVSRDHPWGRALNVNDVVVLRSLSIVCVGKAAKHCFWTW